MLIHFRECILWQTFFPGEFIGTISDAYSYDLASNIRKTFVRQSTFTIDCILSARHAGKTNTLKIIFLHLMCMNKTNIKLSWEFSIQSTSRRSI